MNDPVERAALVYTNAKAEADGLARREKDHRERGEKLAAERVEMDKRLDAALRALRDALGVVE